MEFCNIKMEMRKSILISLLLLLSLVSKSQSYYNILMGQDASAVTYATWNATYSGGSWTLSSGNTVAAVSASNQMIIATIGSSTTGKSTGKWYWEITMTLSSGNRCMGVVNNTTQSNYATWVGNVSSGYSIYSNTGSFTGALFANTSVTNNYFSADYAQGDVLGFALDAGGNSLSIYKNGVLLTPSVTLSGGNYFPAVSSQSATYTANFGASSFTYSVPSGYNAGYY